MWPELWLEHCRKVSRYLNGCVRCCTPISQQRHHREGVTFVNSFLLHFVLPPILGSMRLSSYLSTVVLLQFGSLTFAHSGNEIPVPKIFGGGAAMRHLPRHLIQELQNREAAQPHEETQKRSGLDPQPQKRGGWTQAGQVVKKECGPGVGYCKAGEW